MSQSIARVSLFLLVLLLPSLASAESVGEPGRGSKKANPLKNVYFGEQHLHSENSPDAFATGSRQKRKDAFRYGRGDEVTLSTNGEKIKRKTPYDFVALTDHAEYFGVMPHLIDPKSPLSKTALGKELQNPTVPPTSPDSAVNKILHSILTSTAMPEFVKPEMLVSNWKEAVKTINKYNKPGKFTTLIAFEWTSIPGGKNMHRNVFFRDDEGPAVPFSSFESIYPQDLWTYQEIQRSMGHENIAIPHNGNVSDGWMYSPNKFLAGPMDARYAKRRMLNEPLTEMIQTKGASEAHPAMSPNDEFADFELFPNMINVGKPSQIKYGFVRQALADGLMLERELGINPFKFGIVAGADSHSGYSNNEEFNFHGSHGGLEDSPKKRLNPAPNASGDMPSRLGSAGATAVWAEENTRASIFDAMKSKETYGTSGTLIRLRFFGGWDYSKDLVNDEEFVAKAYAGGVPMGADLPRKPANAKAPTFAIWALKDPETGNLDRIQIIKGYLGGRFDNQQEKIYDVALSDGRKVDAKTSKVPPVGNTVDVKKATYTNDIGDSQLSVVWTDPDFDPSRPAVYYVRVLEIPTPRWSTFDSVKSGLPIPDGVPTTLQERAWSSPIWYSPSQSPASIVTARGHD
jgi:hypothetical protein